jgi:hypothetical protein
MFNARFRLSLSLAAMLVAAAAGDRAQAAPPAPPAAVHGPDLPAERLRLRAELDRVNAEIDALKRAGGPDARLRARMADAEALARRLVELERRMGLTAPASEPRPLPTASPSDGPADLDAKADILADQARRVRAAADALDRRVAELKGRQELRRRAADLDRDPFAPLEGSKRRTISIATGGNESSSSHSTLVPGAPTSAGDRGTASGSSAAPGGTYTGIPIVSSTTSGPVSTPSGSVNVAATPLVVSVELRDLLDPATLADVGRLEHGRPPSSLASLQRAVAALRARAANLDGQARAMRQTAAKP